MPVKHPCERCESTGRDKDNFSSAPVIDGEPRLGEWNAEHLLEILEQESCFTCGGFGRVRGDSGLGDPYKTQANADRARATGKGSECRTCTGSGQIVRLKVWRDCYDCSALGWRPGFVKGEPLPEGISLCDHTSPEFLAEWGKALSVQVVRADRGHTWVEHNIGLGLWSLTDYGDSWALEDHIVAQRVFAQVVEKKHQFIKFTPKDTRVPGTHVIVRLNRGGYSVTVSGVPLIGGMLPPTYTADVLSKEVIG